MVTVALVKWLPALGAIPVMVGYVRIITLFRARAMRGFARRRDFHYIGPSAWSWGLLLAQARKPPIPIPFSLNWTSGEVKQIWNVIEGQFDGVPVLIFDAFIGASKGRYRTFFAANTERTPLGIDTRRERVVQSNGWTIHVRLPFPLELPWATWSMTIGYLEHRLDTLRTGGVSG